MTLLNQLLQSPLDPGYAAAAAARRRAGLPAATRTGGPLLVLATVLIGLLLAASAAALRTPATVATQARQQLVREITARRADGDRLSRQVDALRISVDRAEAAALPGSGGSALLQRARALEVPTGAAAVTGPGITVTLDDATSAGSDGAGGLGGSAGPAGSGDSGSAGGGSGGTSPRDAGSDAPGTVLGRDLQVVVNGLWQSGAEAISVNGERLTSRSAIRFAGEAILVDYRPLTRPYVIAAVGDSAALQTRFADSDAGAYLHALGANYGIQSSVRGAATLRLPAATALTVRAAKPGPAPAGPAAGSPRNTSGTSTSTAPTPPAASQGAAG